MSEPALVRGSHAAIIYVAMPHDAVADDVHASRLDGIKCRTRAANVSTAYVPLAKTVPL